MLELASYLKSELEKRCQKNSAYSLRSFARDLNIDPSNLSKILTKKFRPKEKTQLKILLRLGVEPSRAKKLLKMEREYFQDVDADHFLAISEWYYDAILELTRLSAFKADSKWIASSLGISETRVKLAVEKLQELKLLRIDSSGCWHDEAGNISSHGNPQFTNEAKRRKQKQILEKSLQSIDFVGIERRDHSSTMVCISESDIEEAKKMIQEFRSRFIKFLERKSAGSEQLYQLHIGFFPLTHLKQKG